MRALRIALLVMALVAAILGQWMLFGDESLLDLSVLFLSIYCSAHKY